MKVNEIFPSIQGESKYAGHPVLFIRLAGCTRDCEWCDTSYHKKGKEMSVTKVVREIEKSGMETVVWTGGEPMLQINDIIEVKKIFEEDINFHMETNGDILPQLEYNTSGGSISRYVFEYICFSPKTIATAINLKTFISNSSKLYGTNNDVKVVTDLNVNKELIPYATMLMPLTKGSGEETFKFINEVNKQHVWDYCVKNKIRYCERIHIDVWGTKRGV